MANTNNVLAVANERLESDVQNGVIEVTESFSGNVRNADATTFEAGDSFTITGSEKKYRQKMDGKDRRGNDVYAEWAVVEVHNGDMVTAKNFHIKSVNKLVIEYDKDTKKRKRGIRTKGSLVDLSKQYATNEAFWNAIVGKTITIPSVEEVYTVRFASRDKKEKDDDDFYMAQLPTYNVSE